MGLSLFACEIGSSQGLGEIKGAQGLKGRCGVGGWGVGVGVVVSQDWLKDRGEVLVRAPSGLPQPCPPTNLLVMTWGEASCPH